MPKDHDTEFSALVDRIVESAFALLERKGVTVHNTGLRSRLAAEPGACIRGEQVQFDSQRAAAFLDGFLAGRELQAETGFTASTMSHAHHIVDLDGRCRPITVRDIEEGARLGDALADFGIVGSAPGIPQDVPPALQGIAQVVAGAKYSRAFPGYALRTTPRAEEAIAECYEVLGLTYPIGVHVVSPLRFDGQEIDVALHMLTRLPDAPVCVGTMPILGASAPAAIPAGFVLALAEVLGAGMIFQSLGARRLELSVNVYPMDMRTAAVVYGTPANIAINLLEMKVNQRLKTSIPSKSFKTMSQRPDPQAAAQKAFFTGSMAALGKRTFTGAGCLSLDEIYSPAQLMIDCEILQLAKRTVEMTEICLTEDQVLLDTLVENANGSFLTDPTTLTHFSRLQWDSALFPNRLLQQWLAAGSPECLDTARERAEALLRQHTWGLDRDKASALDAILLRARDTLG